MLALPADGGIEKVTATHPPPPPPSRWSSQANTTSIRKGQGRRTDVQIRLGIGKMENEDSLKKPKR